VFGLTTIQTAVAVFASSTTCSMSLAATDDDRSLSLTSASTQTPRPAAVAAAVYDGASLEILLFIIFRTATVTSLNRTRGTVIVGERENQQHAAYNAN